MSDIGLIMNALLGVLLVGALFLGWRLEGRLKALRASHQSFSQAVGDLDRAAARAEQGLADLRAATDEAADTLAARIDRAGHLAGRLEKLTAEAEGVHTRLVTAPRLEAPRAAPRPEASRPEALRPEAARSPAARPAESRESAFARFAERYGSAKAGPSPSALADAAARNDLILEDDEAPAPRATSPALARLSPEAAARMERLQALARPKAAPARPNSRADEDLFEAPPRRVAGGLR
ncbi:MAG TPA: DUF6468 domain-containing protein [Caulobacteraceae bacterium]|nr:DUF6468 domain-containing protein [Caulobacteraceae bacterium]